MSEVRLPELLAQFSPFEGLDEQYIGRVAEHAKLTSEPKGTLLFRRGKKAQYRFYLVEGSVELVGASFSKESVSSSDERAKQALTETSPTQVSAVAKSSVTLLQVESDFLDLALAWSQAPSGAADRAAPDREPEVVAAQLKPADNLGEGGLENLNLAFAHVQVEEGHGDWMSGLLASPLFTKVPPAHIQQLFTKFEPVEVKAGTEVIKEGASGDYFYVIDEGQAQVTTITGKVDVVLEIGQYFGEEALVAETPRNATVTMVTDGVLMRLCKEDFTTLLHEPVQKTLTREQFDADPKRYVLLDVRMPLEYRCYHAPNSQNMPLSSLRNRLGELDVSAQYTITDDGGRRSQLAAYLLCQAGFDASILQGTEALDHQDI